jgi:putative flavoprotein involved in K+ transport
VTTEPARSAGRLCSFRYHPQVREDEGVVVIGGGQAGLATSHELTRAGVPHVVLERNRIGETWRNRWDSFCLVTPNWSVKLPGGEYDGDDPDGYMVKDDIVSHLERYATSFSAPVREGVAVSSVAQVPEGGFLVETSDGEMRAGAVVVATGTYRTPYRPAGASSLPADLPQLDLDAYRSPSALPPGDVLVVGSGQSGCQIAEELVEAGREVFLSCGRAPWVQRTIGDSDIVWWAAETGFLDMPVSALASPAARLEANILATGHGGGHTLNLRTLRAQGVTLLGHFAGAEGHVARFAPDLGDAQAWGDDRYRKFRELVANTVSERGWSMPDMPDPEPFDGSAPETVDLSGIGAVLFTGGFRPDFSWVRIPGACDEMGFPLQKGGASTVAPGLYFVGVHFQRKRKSSIFYGVGEDASIVAGHIASGR